MSKELPYFKFEPNSWEAGMIQMCSRESKGLFIDMCSLYWSRLGELPYAFALQKLCNGNKDAMHELMHNEIILIDDGNIIIEFLDEQLNEFLETSEKRRVAANKRWNASAMQMQCKSNAIKRREEEKRGDEKREKNNKFIIPEISEIKSYCLERRNSVDPNKFYDHYQSNGWMVGKNKMKDWKAAVRTWEKNREQSQQIYRPTRLA